MQLLDIIGGKIVRLVTKSIVNPCRRLRLKNKDFTLIASNCNGTYLLYDLKLKYNTPTINLYIVPRDFVRFCANIDYYLGLELTFVQGHGVDYPVGMLDDVTIHFMHYASIDNARDKWNQRLKRVNKDNIFFLMAERDGCTYHTLRAFDELPVRNKLVLTHKSYPEFSSAYKISGFEREQQVGELHEYKHNFSCLRYLYDFNFVEWFNSNL